MSLNKDIRQVDILGTTYKVMWKNEGEDLLLDDYRDGYCDTSIKCITVKNQQAKEDSVKDLQEYEAKVLRHEILHAFFYESGLDVMCDFAQNEEMIDWIALQFDKITNAFDKFYKV